MLAQVLQIPYITVSAAAKDTQHTFTHLVFVNLVVGHVTESHRHKALLPLTGGRVQVPVFQRVT